MSWWDFLTLPFPREGGDANQAEAAAVSEATTAAGRAAATAAGSVRMISMARASRRMWTSGHNGDIGRAATAGRGRSKSNSTVLTLPATKPH
jgi:hypothetical protein